MTHKSCRSLLCRKNCQMTFLAICILFSSFSSILLYRRFIHNISSLTKDLGLVGGPFAPPTPLSPLVDQGGKSQETDPDYDCPFRNSAIYRSIYVYPSPESEEWVKNESGVVTGKREIFSGRYPWDEIDDSSHKLSIGPYDIDNDELMQVRLCAIICSCCTSS